jgi:hypothetical protein
VGETQDSDATANGTTGCGRRKDGTAQGKQDNAADPTTFDPGQSGKQVCRRRLQASRLWLAPAQP